VSPEAVLLAHAKVLDTLVLTARAEDVAMSLPNDLETSTATVRPTVIVSTYWFTMSVTIWTLATKLEAVSLAHAAALPMVVLTARLQAVVIVLPHALPIVTATVKAEFVARVAAQVLAMLTPAVRPAVIVAV